MSKLSNKFEVRQLLNKPPHFKCIATLSGDFSLIREAASDDSWFLTGIFRKVVQQPTQNAMGYLTSCYSNSSIRVHNIYSMLKGY